MIVNHILKAIKFDVRSTTGSNLRNIMLATGKSSVEKLEISDFKSIQYHPIAKEDSWRPEMILELTDIKFDILEVEGFSHEELEDILSYACTSWLLQEAVFLILFLLSCSFLQESPGSTKLNVELSIHPM